AQRVGGNVIPPAAQEAQQDKRQKVIAECGVSVIVGDAVGTCGEMGHPPAVTEQKQDRDGGGPVQQLCGPATKRRGVADHFAMFLESPGSQSGALRNVKSSVVRCVAAYAAARSSPGSS